MRKRNSSRGSRRPKPPLLLTLALLAAIAASAAAPAEAQARAYFPAQALGNRGVNVGALQHLLRAHGQEVVVSGVFTPGTQAAVAFFQRSSELPLTGVADTATWQKLVVPLGEGSRGEAVFAAQLLLERKDGGELALSGTYDATTAGAVRSFQRRVGLQRTGSVDGATWRHLLWHYVFPDFRAGSMCNYHSGNGKRASWGTSAAVGQLEAAAALFGERTGLDVSVGEVSWRYGGRLPGHSTHAVGLDVDIGLIRRDGRHCRSLGLDHRQRQYDREATRALIEAIYETAPGMVKLIYFNDPVLVREGLVQRYPNHHHHLHVRYCEPDHDQARYRCRAPALPDDANLEAALIGELGQSYMTGMRPGLANIRYLHYLSR